MKIYFQSVYFAECLRGSRVPFEGTTCMNFKNKFEENNYKAKFL